MGNSSAISYIKRAHRPKGVLFTASFSEFLFQVQAYFRLSPTLEDLTLVRGKMTSCEICNGSDHVPVNCPSKGSCGKCGIPTKHQALKCKNKWPSFDQQTCDECFQNHELSDCLVKPELTSVCDHCGMIIRLIGVLSVPVASCRPVFMALHTINSLPTAAKTILMVNLAMWLQLPTLLLLQRHPLSLKIRHRTCGTLL